jgi:hypothetical protein
MFPQNVKQRFTTVQNSMAVYWVAAPCSLVKSTDVSEVLAASISILMMKAANMSETSVNVYQTTPLHNPEDGHLHTGSCENLTFRQNDHFMYMKFSRR